MAMTFNFNEDYLIQTMFGPCNVILIKYDDVFPTTQGVSLDITKMSYKGTPISDNSIELRGSTIWTNDNNGDSVGMGNILIHNNDNIPLGNGYYFYRNYNYRGAYWDDKGVRGSGHPTSTSDYYVFTYLFLFVDNNDQAFFDVRNMRGDAASAAYVVNTSTTYGYADTRYSNGISQGMWAVGTKLASTGLITNASTALENVLSTIPTDPYAEGGTSTTGGGDGSFDLHNDSIDFPNLPTLSAVDTGLVSIYTPSLAQLKALATFLWNANPTDVDWWKKLVANPLDLILGLSIVPVQVPQGASQTIKVGLIDTGVSVTKAASQFVTVDCGSVTIQKNCGGSALDFSPFTKFSLYLPFIGTRTISCDDIMGRTVHVKYNVDLLSGGCTAMVKITGGPDDNQLDAILYQYSGACAISIPLTGETFTNMITSTIQLAASIGATVATGGAAAGVTAASAANSLMSMKPIVERAGGVSGAAGQLGIMIPYLIAEVPRQSVPENCNKFTGYPSNIKATIGDLTGYTEVEIVYLQGIEATQAELDELESVLKGGFII